MAFGLLTVGSGYGQFGFVGTNGIILADASTLTVNVSGATNQQLVNPIICGLVNSTTLLGISSPNTGGGNAFGFMYQSGTFSTFALPSSFVDTDSSYQFYLFNQDGNVTDLWVAAISATDNGGYPYLLNLSVIAGLTTGTDIVDTFGNAYWSGATDIGSYALVGGVLFGAYPRSNIVSSYDISTSTFDHISAPFTFSATPNLTVFGANLACVDNQNNIQLITTSGSSLRTILATSFSTIATANPILYNYLGTLMYVNPALNLACSMNLNTGYVSPIFPFNINPAAGSVGGNSFDQSTGIMYLSVGGSQPNMFGNLTPMLLT